MILRTVQDEGDVERFSAFHSKYESELWGITSDLLLRHHPASTYSEFLLVEDEETGEIVSTTCLIPWRICYEDVSLDAAMLEMTLTHPDYRGRGLIRDQIKRLHQMFSTRRYDLAVIIGIPYFYRQFGYTYAIDFYGADLLPKGAIPDPPDSKQSHYQLRQAAVVDVPALAQLYDDTMRAVRLHDARDCDYWRFLLQRMQLPVRVVDDLRDGRIVGYVCSGSTEKGAVPHVLESAIAAQDVGMFVLRQLKAEAEANIRIDWPQTGTLVQLARSLGSATLPAQQWLVRITDVAGLLMRIGPTLEHRIACSAFAGFTGEFAINLFCEAFKLEFQQATYRKFIHSASCLSPMKPASDPAAHADGPVITARRPAGPPPPPPARGQDLQVFLCKRPRVEQKMQ